VGYSIDAKALNHLSNDIYDYLDIQEFDHLYDDYRNKRYLGDKLAYGLDDYGQADEFDPSRLFKRNLKVKKAEKFLDANNIEHEDVKLILGNVGC
jgi:hypothetical protein